MRQSQQKNRMRGRGRKQPNPMSRNYESNGPDVKIRGNAAHVAEKYTALARDALSAGDRVMGENYLQHAEHYNRIVAAAQANANRDQENNPNARFQQPDFSSQNFDDDEDDADEVGGYDRGPESRQFPDQRERNEPRERNNEQRERNDHRERNGESRERNSHDQRDRNQPREARERPEPRERHDSRDRQDSRERQAPRERAESVVAAEQPEMGEAGERAEQRAPREPRVARAPRTPRTARPQEAASDSDQGEKAETRTRREPRTRRRTKADAPDGADAVVNGGNGDAAGHAAAPSKSGGISDDAAKLPGSLLGMGGASAETVVSDD